MGDAAPIAMSALMFAGSAQFAALAVLAADGSVAAAVGAGILLNLRYLPMGIALAPSLHGGPLRRALIGQGMVDASWALANRGGGRFDPAFMVGATLPSYPAWVGGTAIGVLAGDAIGDPERLGLDAMFPAFFLGLLLAGELRDGGSPSRSPCSAPRSPWPWCRSRHRQGCGAVRSILRRRNLLDVLPRILTFDPATSPTQLDWLRSTLRLMALEAEGLRPRRRDRYHPPFGRADRPSTPRLAGE